MIDNGIINEFYFFYFRWIGLFYLFEVDDIYKLFVELKIICFCCIL